MQEKPQRAFRFAARLLIVLYTVIITAILIFVIYFPLLFIAVDHDLSGPLLALIPSLLIFPVSIIFLFVRRKKRVLIFLVLFSVLLVAQFGALTAAFTLIDDGGENPAITALKIALWWIPTVAGVAAYYFTMKKAPLLREPDLI
ncbi:MAG TPA: hypothetical protein VFD05_05070 [Bacilli bacterium]|nr:hypothetical protein [Bacilli bacterium]